jgi:uncharacterized Zn finger protein (UPF0148 family)
VGWKNIKERFGIAHIVFVEDVRMKVGSGDVRGLIEIDMNTGVVVVDPAWPEMKHKYRDLFDATPEEILALVAKPDTFESSLPVFTYRGAEIIEKACEQYGWPNATHDGEVQYDNTHSADRATVVAWAKQSAAAEVAWLAERLERARQEAREIEERLKAAKATAEQLAREHP